jgi:hypothetical protein
MLHRASAVFLVLVVSVSAFAQGGMLYGVDISADQLGTIDRNTAAFTPIGPNGAGVVALTGLAYDANQDVLYAIQPGSPSLYTVNQSSGLATLVGPTLLGNANGLAFDPNANLLYAADLGNALYTLNVLTGNATLVAPITGAGAIEGLGFDSATGTLYGLSDSLDKVVTISTSTGVATPLPTTLPSTGLWRGLDWDSELGVLWASKVNSGQLFQVDPITGAGTLIGALPTFVQGLAFKPGLPEYQVNQAAASLSINGIQGTGQSFALVNLLVGQTASVSLASTSVGQPWEVVAGVAPLIPRSAGALVITDGQLVNVDLSDAALTFVWNFFQSPPFANAVLPVSFPAPGLLSLQMAVLDPNSPVGFALSQPVRLVIQ